MTGTAVKLTGDQVKYVRARLGLSQAALAERLAVSQPVIFRLERKAGEVLTGPEIILIAQIAAEAGIAVPSPEECASKIAEAAA